MQTIVYRYARRARCHYLSPLALRFLLLLAVFSAALTAQASPIIFDLRSVEVGGLLDDTASGELTVSGLGARFASYSATSAQTRFNLTSTRFGINTLDTTADSASLIDAAGGNSEYLSVSFNSDILLEKIVLSAFSPGEYAGLQIGNRAVLLLEGLAAGIDNYFFVDYRLDSGELLWLSHVAGNGFSFDSLAVSLVEVSEPTTFSLLVLAGLMLVAVRNSAVA